MRDGITTPGERATAEPERIAQRMALLHAALLSIASLGPEDAGRAPEIARRALERRLGRD